MCEYTDRVTTERRQQAEWFDKRAREIAAALGAVVIEREPEDGWNNWATLARKRDGVRVFMQRAYPDKSRLRFSEGLENELKEHKRYNEEPLAITTAGDKDAAKIAADIERRLVPGIIERRARWTEAKEKTEAYEREKTGGLERLADAAGRLGRINGGNPSFSKRDAVLSLGGSSYSKPWGFSGSCEYSSGNASLHLSSLSLEKAEKVIKYLVELYEAEGPKDQEAGLNYTLQPGGKLYSNSMMVPPMLPGEDFSGYIQKLNPVIRQALNLLEPDGWEQCRVCLQSGAGFTVKP